MYLKKTFIFLLLLIVLFLCGCNNTNEPVQNESGDKSGTTKRASESRTADNTTESGTYDIATKISSTESATGNKASNTATTTGVSQIVIETKKTEDTECKYIIFGKELISDNKAYINYKEKYVEIPFLATVKALGGEVKWTSEIKSIIILNEKRLELNIVEKSLNEENHNFNMFDMPPGGSTNGRLYYDGNDLMVDESRINYFLRYYTDGTLKVDYNKGVITITNR